MIEIKDDEKHLVLIGLLLHRFHTTLVEVLCWIIELVGNITITESFRCQLHPNDLHGTLPVRAADLREWIYPDPQWIVQQINAAWEYDYERPEMVVALYHENRKTKGKHFHIQVHPNTGKL